MKTRQNYNKSFWNFRNGTYVRESDIFWKYSSKSITVSNIDKMPYNDVSGYKVANSFTLTVSKEMIYLGEFTKYCLIKSAISGNSANYVVKENGNYTLSRVVKWNGKNS